MRIYTIIEINLDLSPYRNSSLHLYIPAMCKKAFPEFLTQAIDAALDKLISTDRCDMLYTSTLMCRNGAATPRCCVDPEALVLSMRSGDWLRITSRPVQDLVVHHPALLLSFSLLPAQQRASQPLSSALPIVSLSPFAREVSIPS